MAAVSEHQQLIARISEYQSKCNQETQLIKQLKDKMQLIQDEEKAKTKLLERMEDECGKWTHELKQGGFFRVDSSDEESEEERTADEIQNDTIADRFSYLIDHSVKFRRPKHKQVLDKDGKLTDMHCVVVFIPPDGKVESMDEKAFRITHTLRFADLLEDSCRFFDIHPDDCMLVDSVEKGAQWPLDALVASELQKYAKADIFLKMMSAENADEEAGHEEEEEVHDDKLNVDKENELDLEQVEEESEEDPMEKEMREEEERMRRRREKPPVNRRQLKIELIFFISFVSVYILNQQGFRRSVPSSFQVVDAIRREFCETKWWNDGTVDGSDDGERITFEDIRTFGDMFQWFEFPFRGGLFPATDASLPPSEKGYIRTYNKIVGAIRVRQVRVQENNPCSALIPVQYVQDDQTGETTAIPFVDYCYEQYLCVPADNPNPETCNADKLPFSVASNMSFPLMFGLPGQDPEERSEDAVLRCLLPVDEGGMDGNCPPEVTYMYRNPEQLDATAATQVRGTTGQVYDNGGYVRDFQKRTEDGYDLFAPSDYDDLINDLMYNRFLDKQTRAIIVTFPTYNANYNTFCQCTFLFEFSPGGIIKPIATFKILKLVSPFEPYQKLIGQPGIDIFDALGDVTLDQFILEAISMVFMMGFTVAQISNMYTITRRTGSYYYYWVDLFNVLEFMNIISWMASLAFRLIFLLVPTRTTINIFSEKFVDLSEMAALYDWSFSLDSVTLLMITFKFFKYFQLSPQMNLLWDTLVFSSKDLFYFFVMYLMLMFGFSLLALMLFGTSVTGFGDIMTVNAQLLIIVMGDIEVYEEIRETQFGIFYFWIFVFFMFLMLINIFLAVLADAYGRAKAVADEAVEAARKRKVKITFKDYAMLLKALVNKKPIPDKFKPRKVDAHGNLIPITPTPGQAH